MATYFTFSLANGRTAGLLRRRGIMYEAVKGGVWVDDPSLIRFFECFWGDQVDVVELTLDEARTRAAELGVTLGGGEHDG